jgi:hypothetical protein
MTFWDFATHAIEWLSNYVTRIIAISTGTLVTLTGTGIIPDRHLKYYMAAIAVLTYWRGQSTGKTYVQAKAALAANPSSQVPVTPKE